MDVTPEQLREALDHAWVHAANREGIHHGQIADADEVARNLWEYLAYDPGVPDEHKRCWHLALNPEMRRMAEMRASLEALDGSQSHGRASVRRVLAYLAGTYGYVLVDDED